MYFFVVGPLQIGGTERQLLAVAPGLQKAGWKVCVYSTAGYGPLCEEFNRAGVETILTPVRREGRKSVPRRAAGLAVVALHLFWILIARRPKIVHFLLPAAYHVGGPIAVLTRSPVRVTSRRCLNNYQRGRPFIRALERRLHRAMAAVLANSRTVARQLLEEGVPQDRIGLIYNGVDTARFLTPIDRNAVRAAVGVSNSTLVFISVANLLPQKGHRDLLNAFGKASQTLPNDWRLLLVGDDYNLEAMLRQQAVALGIHEHVSFLGPRSDVPDLLRVSDVAVLASLEEGFSNAVLEAMAAGLPVIATDVGGNPEAIVNGDTGFVVPVSDPVRLAQAIGSLGGDENLRRRFGENAARRVRENFALDRCVEIHDALYRALLFGAGPQSIEELRISK